MRGTLILGVLVAVGCSSDIEYADESDAGATGGAAGTHSLDAASEWGTGGSSPVDSGADATQADAPGPDAPAPCTNVVPFDIDAEADSIIVPEAPGCANEQASINHGPDPTLLVGLDSCPNLSEGIVRFPVAPKLAAAFAKSNVLDASLVIVGDPDLKGNFVAGTLNVFAMTSAWDEGTGAYDGAQWYFATVACPCGPPSNSCCDYKAKWALPGAAGTADRQSLPAANVHVKDAPEVLSVKLDASRLAPRVGATLSVLLQTDDTLKLFFVSKDGANAKGVTPPRLVGNYCETAG